VARRNQPNERSIRRPEDWFPPDRVGVASTTDLSTKVDNGREIISGGGLTGGGDLTADRTLAVGAGTGITVNADDVAIDLTAEAERIRDIIGAALTAGANVSITVNDAGDTITIDATVPAGYTDEQVRDVIGAALVQGTGITITVNDAGDTITIASSITQYTDELAQDAIAALIAAGTNTGMSISYNDAGNTLSIAIDTTAEAERVRDTIGTALVAGNSVSITVDDAGDTITIAQTPNIQSVVSAATVTPTFANDLVKITAQAVGLTLANPTGTAVPGRGLAIRIKDNGTARAISFDTQYRALGVTLPTTTVISKTLYLGLIYNSDDTKWDVVAVAQQA
jgi:hypothetical protein